MERQAGLSVVVLPGLPLFAPGMSIAEEVVAAAARCGKLPGQGDVVVIAQKIVSKTEDRAVSLGNVVVSDPARKLASETGRNPALAQLILDESSEILRATRIAIVTRHRSGHVLANAGIDASNIDGGTDGTVLLWPKDSDASARTIRADLTRLTGNAPAIVIADSMGRAWRIGTLGTAIGVAGLAMLEDRRGQADLMGRTLQATIIAVADAVASAAVLAMGEGAEGTPVAIVRGAERWWSAEDGPGTSAGLRPLDQDMFR